METKEQIRDFTKKFFINLNCKVLENPNSLVIEQVPASFEKFIGKNSPYLLVFDKSDEKENTELLAKGSYFLQALTSFLENQGSTSLLKVNFNIDPTKLIDDKIKLLNSKVIHGKTDIEYKLMTRFSFITTLQYLNEKEQIVNHVLMENGKISSRDISNYELKEGNRKEVDLQAVRDDYEVAKDNIKLLLKDKLEEVKQKLIMKMQKEKNRIEDHYNNMRKELEKQSHRIKEQIEELKKENSSDPLIAQKLVRLNESLYSLKIDEKTNQIKAEEEFFLKDERQKHSLSMNTKLMNTSIIYYPQFDYQLFFKNESATRLVEIHYDPVEDQISKVNCEICKSELNDVVLCGSGHIFCQKCGDHCPTCGKVYCNGCLTKKCEFCYRTICRKCMVSCSSCGKKLCSTHCKRDEDSVRMVCLNCIASCSICSKTISKKNVKIDSLGRQLCQECNKKESVKRIINSR
jgi:hypothetical protein